MSHIMDEKPKTQFLRSTLVTFKNSRIPSDSVVVNVEKQMILFPRSGTEKRFLRSLEVKKIRITRLKRSNLDFLRQAISRQNELDIAFKKNYFKGIF